MPFAPYAVSATCSFRRDIKDQGDGNIKCQINAKWDCAYLPISYGFAWIGCGPRRTSALKVEKTFVGEFLVRKSEGRPIKFESRIKELVETIPDLAVLVEPLLVVRRALREQIVILHRRLLAIVRDDEVCRRLMTTPGVGPVVALTYRATVDVPARFRKFKSVGAVFGLTCSRYQSGENDWSGRISRCGDEMMRMMLYEAAQSMLHSKKWSWLKAWAMQIARRRGMKKAIVALARRLAVIMHRIGLTAPSSGGPGRQPRQQHENRSGSHRGAPSVHMLRRITIARSRAGNALSPTSGRRSVDLHCHR